MAGTGRWCEFRRVVITGIGVVSPVGIGKEEYFSSLLAGRSGVGAITRFDTTGFPVRIAAEVKGFDPWNYMERKAANRDIDSYGPDAEEAELLALPEFQELEVGEWE